MKVVHTETEYQKMLVEARHFYLAAPVILPLLDKRKADAFARLLVSFKGGKSDNMTIVAELSVLADLEREVRVKLQTYIAEEEKHGNRGTTGI